MSVDVSRADSAGDRPDDLVELTIGPPAHGGHCVARHEGRVVFVRHTLPGERVLARITARTRRYWRADAVQILDPAADRVASRWPQAGPGGVGGGELAHVAPAAQLRWKRTVVRDTLSRIGRLEPDHPALGTFDVAAVPVPGEHPDSGYRTRVTVIADDEGRAGMYRYRSHEVLAVDRLPLAHRRIQDLDLPGRRWRPGARITAVAPSVGEPVILVDGDPTARGPGRVREQVDLADAAQHHRPTGTAQFTYRVRAAGFWQVHAGAPATLVAGVLTAAALQPGERVWDLYSGAGLLTTPLADQVGPDGRVDAVEGDRAAGADARRNAHGLDQIALHTGDVADLVGAAGGGRSGRTRRSGRGGTAATSGQRLHPAPDVVVLDPPRTGAGRAVMQAITAASPRRVVYVACDPAALGRDLGTARERGYELVDLAGFDIFPHTHHVECIATLDRVSRSGI